MTNRTGRALAVVAIVVSFTTLICLFIIKFDMQAVDKDSNKSFMVLQSRVQDNFDRLREIQARQFLNPQRYEAWCHPDGDCSRAFSNASTDIISR